MFVLLILIVSSIFSSIVWCVSRIFFFWKGGFLSSLFYSRDGFLSNLFFQETFFSRVIFPREVFFSSHFSRVYRFFLESWITHESFFLESLVALGFFCWCGCWFSNESFFFGRTIKFGTLFRVCIRSCTAYSPYTYFYVYSYILKFRIIDIFVIIWTQVFFKKKNEKTKY